MEPTFALHGRSALIIAAAALFLCAPALAPAQELTEYALPKTSTGPKPIVVGPDGALWFIETGIVAVGEANPPKVGRITTDGALTEFPISATQDQVIPGSLVTGPDGALWFSQINSNLIGRITTAGIITTFKISTFITGPLGITVGPDGALWFAESSPTTNAIGRITTAGSVTEFKLPTSNSGPSAITTGPDGALWFTEQSTNRIGRITTSGEISEYPTPTAGFPNAIVAGPDGALWFTEQDGNIIGQITTAGVITEFKVPTEGRQPSGIAVGPDGAIWAALMANANVNGTQTSALGRIPTSGVGGVTEILFPLSSPSAGKTPTGIVTGPDGALWFTAPGIDSIDRYLPAPSTTPGSLVAAVLPSSRSVQVAKTATAFATMINAGTAAATGCAISPATTVPASFFYQTTDMATNALSGSPNTPATIAAGAAQSFLIAFTPTAPFTPVDVQLSFDCTDLDPAPSYPGLNTLLLSASATPVPDIVALAVTATNDGIIHIPGSTGTGAFAVATSNLGSADTITVSAQSGAAALPLALSLCQTNPTTGQCLAPPAASVTTSIAAGATPTFSFFATASGAVPLAPAANRIFVQFIDSASAVRGSTSVAVETN